MAKEQETLWSLEKAEQSAKDIQFWKAEYMKKKLFLILIMKNCYIKLDI